MLTKASRSLQLVFSTNGFGKRDCVMPINQQTSIPRKGITMANKVFNNLMSKVVAALEALFNNVTAEFLTDKIRGTGGTPATAGTPSAEATDRRKSGDLTYDDEAAEAEAMLGTEKVPGFTAAEVAHWTFLKGELIKDETKDERACFRSFLVKIRLREDRTKFLKLLVAIDSRTKFRAALQVGGMLDPQGVQAKAEKYRKLIEKHLEASTEGATEFATHVGAEFDRLKVEREKRKKRWF
jgi:hypothetical protein